MTHAYLHHQYSTSVGIWWWVSFAITKEVIDGIARVGDILPIRGAGIDVDENGYATATLGGVTIGLLVDDHVEQPYDREKINTLFRAEIDRAPFVNAYALRHAIAFADKASGKVYVWLRWLEASTGFKGLLATTIYLSSAVLFELEEDAISFRLWMSESPLRD